MEDIQKHYDEFKKNHEAFYNKNNKSACRRARKSLMKLSKLIIPLRKQLLTDCKALPKKTTQQTSTTQ